MCKRILIVDDDATFACGIMNKFMMKDCAFSLADSLTRARTMIKNNSYDLVLANTKVPGGNSYALKDDIKLVSPDTRVVFMSAMQKEYDTLTSLGETCIRKNEVYACGAGVFGA